MTENLFACLRRQCLAASLTENSFILNAAVFVSKTVLHYAYIYAAALSAGSTQLAYQRTSFLEAVWNSWVKSVRCRHMDRSSSSMSLKRLPQCGDLAQRVAEHQVGFQQEWRVTHGAVTGRPYPAIWVVVRITPQPIRVPDPGYCSQLSRSWKRSAASALKMPPPPATSSRRSASIETLARTTSDPGGASAALPRAHGRMELGDQPCPSTAGRSIPT